MFVKLQSLDTNCLQILNSVKTPLTNIGGVSVSVSPHSERVEQQPIKNPTKVAQKSHIYYRNPPPHDTKIPVLKKSNLSHEGLLKNPERELGGNSRGNGKNENKRDFKARVWRRKEKAVVGELHTNYLMKCVNGDGVVEKVQTKCSTKWVGYGGCIPLILEALETVSDLDEAFKPWEDSLSRKERSIILKEQKGWERALEIFEWFKRKKCYEVNVIHYNIMLRILGKAHRWSEVEKLWDEMEKKRIAPINSTYGTLIDVYSKGGLREKAMYLLELMNEQEMEPDEVTMGVVVQMYKKSGEFGKAEDFFKTWSVRKCVAEAVGNSKPSKVAALNGDSQAHVSLSSYTYNTLIDTYGKAGRLKDAFETFELMLREGIVPNTVTFNTMIHIFGSYGRLEEVASLMQKMEQVKCLPDTRTYNILIFLHAKHDNIEMAAGYFKKMKENSLEPDFVSYRTLLYAFSIRHMVGEAEELVDEINKSGLQIDEFTHSAITRMYIEAGMLDKSWLWFKRFHLEWNMSSECYAANIDAFGERGHLLEAEKVFRCCQEGRKASVLEFNVMIKAYGINKRYDEACLLVDGMENHSIFPDKCSYSSLIQMLASADLPQKAIFYVRKMQGAGLMSDCIPYCAVISSFAKLGQLEKAVGVFKEMIGFNVQPDVVVYGVLINAYADIGSVQEALNYVNAMKDRGLSMNAIIYKTLIKLYTRIGSLKDAEDAYHMLQRLEVGPDVYSSNCMIDLYSERSMVKPAEEIFEKLRKSGHANEFSYAMMLCMYKKIGKVEEAIQIAQNMRELGLLTDLLSYNNMLGLYASDGRFKEAVSIFKEMMESSVQPNDSTFRALGVVLIKRGVPKQAVANLEVMWKKDYQSGLQAWMSTLDSVVGIIDHDDDDDE